MDYEDDFISDEEDDLIRTSKVHPNPGPSPKIPKLGKIYRSSEDTPILTWSGEIKAAKDITIKDQLVGDDGLPRNIIGINRGVDDLYDVAPTSKIGMPYRINGQYMLTLQCSEHKLIRWGESERRWCLTYYDITSGKIKNKSVAVNIDAEKEIKKQQLLEFAKNIPDNNIFDISVQTFLSLAKSNQKLMRSTKITTSINWPKRDVPIDPYIFGMWLGDGCKNGYGFSSADHELVKEWVKYANTIGMEVVHAKNYNGKESYLYRIRRIKGTTADSIKNEHDIIAVGHPDHSSATCSGCLTSGKIHEACNWVYDEKDNIPNKSLTSPFVDILKEYDLHENKWVPEVYVFNDSETRLQLLAGLIDTDGYLKYRGEGNNELFDISQEITSHGHIIDSAEYIARSLGFKTTIILHNGQKILHINGDIYRIPTKLPRKKTIKTKSANELSRFEVNPVGKEKYINWKVDGNGRYLLGDFTVTRGA